jgi:hypothetical protein
VWQVQDWRYNARISQMQEAHAVSLKNLTEAARAQEHALGEAKQKAEEAYAVQKRKSDVAARNARAELDGLRNELYALPAPDKIGESPAAAPVAHAATVERKLLGECASALVEVAAGADGLAAQLVGLQNYVMAAREHLDIAETQLVGLHSYVSNICVAPK